MVVPVGKKVRVLTTAADVVHAWWIPAFGVKQDAMPGFIRDLHFKAEKTGTFRGQCVELCGKEHGFMPIVVRVVSQDDYTKWVGEHKKAMAAAADDPSKQWSLDELKGARREGICGELRRRATRRAARERRRCSRRSTARRSSTGRRKGRWTS
jgi:heme/copper-type cytochrome/quinol oxidase subunit 2